MSDGRTILPQLMALIEDRRANRPAGSYTTRLLDGGVDAIGAKICEEAAELVEAAREAEQAPEHVIHEAADLVYHLLVMLAHCRLTLSDVERELTRRFGTSGLDEKARRSSR